LRGLPDSPAWRAEADLSAGKKDRADHRHHTVDAIVVALTSRSRLQQLATLYRRGKQPDEILPGPWPNFHATVVEAVKAINVSHRVQPKVRGALHEETIYGPTAKPSRQRAGERPWAKG